ncbi:MAG TPA: type II secretion system protein GspK [Polyangiaceae bacterium]
MLGALTILTIMLTEFQGETSTDLGSALERRDALQAEYAAKSAVNLARLLIAAEPTIRGALSPILALMMNKGKPPQLPVWQFADEVLGAFNNESGMQAFSNLSGVNAAEGENLGLKGAGFEVKVVDEDSKINLNMAATGNLFAQQRLGLLLTALMRNPQYDHMFEGRDADGNFSDRSAVCGAIIDWTDPDQNASSCEFSSQNAQNAAPEDPYYQRLKPAYQRKNAALDSLEELHLVRGVSDRFWETFVDPDPDDPEKRSLTVWGAGKGVNINTANPVDLLQLACFLAVQDPPQPLCADPDQQAKFLTLVGLVKGFVRGAPLFSTPDDFINMLTGKSQKGSLFDLVKSALQIDIKPVQLISDQQVKEATAVESKVFSIYATGVVRAGKRETHSRIHAVVDFRDAPAPGAPPAPNTAQSTPPPGDPAGDILYYRVD